MQGSIEGTGDTKGALGQSGGASVPNPFMALYKASASWLASKPWKSFTDPL